MNSFGPESWPRLDPKPGLTPCSLGPRAEKFHSRQGAGRKEMGEAIQVINKAFFLIFPCNHIINIKKKISFFRRSKREHNFSLFFLLNMRPKTILPPYTLSPPTLSAHPSAHPSLTHPPIPHPSLTHPIRPSPTLLWFWLVFSFWVGFVVRFYWMKFFCSNLFKRVVWGTGG